ncbi:tetratricopeptide repeat protein [Tahibacter amnicola]|uniref:tetratricopeptide repeat protein n=1 Tax=Tahibacter amnicola TaxID=2976241 RepID=UPI003CCD610F
MRSDPFDRIAAKLRGGRYDEVVGELTDGKRIRPPFGSDCNHAWYLVGDAYARSGRWEEALAAFKKSVRSWPEDSEALWAVAGCYDSLGRPKLAERYYAAALKLRPASCELMFNLANVIADQGRYRDAIRIYRKIRPKSGTFSRQVGRNLALAEKSLATFDSD